MSPHFLSRTREILTADGSFHALGADDGAAWRRPLVLLARELCSFAWLDTGRAPARAAAAAARLHARTAAPFVQPGILLRRGAGGVGIWWWDKAWVDQRLVERFAGRSALVAPETLAQPAGEGWRIVRATPGYEAQCWSSGALVGSAWRREPFDASAWQAFARIQRAASEPASTGPPAPMSAPLSLTPSIGAMQSLDLTGADGARLAACGLAAAMLAAIGLFSGQALHLRSLSEKAEAETAAMRAALTRAGPPDRAASQRLAAFRKLSDRPDAAASLSVALGILQLYGVQPRGFSADAKSLTLTLPYSALGKVDHIAQDLEATGAFSDAQPVTNAQSQVIDLKLTLRRRPPRSSSAD